LSHRLSCAWFKFHSLQQTLTNKNVPISLKLKLFNATVTPTILYSLTTTLLTKTQLVKLDIAQRKMLRRMVGWVISDDDTWEDAGRRMKARLEGALMRYPIPDWSLQRNRNRERIMTRVAKDLCPELVSAAITWQPAEMPIIEVDVMPHRNRGKPRQRWDD